MKKILFILIMCISIVACNKHEIEDVETTPMVTISFDQQIVSSNSMVRSETNEFLDIIEEQTPDYVNVTLKNLDLDKTYTCKSNETITIPVGNYEIHAMYEGKFVTVGKMEYRACPYYSTPHIKCDLFTQYISSNTNSIKLNVYYDCYAIFTLVDECSKSYLYYDNENCPFPQINKYYIAFFRSDVKINLEPYSDSTEFITTTYNFSTTYDVNKVFAEFGKYYVIHPQKVNKTTSSFELNLVNMTEGEL